MAAEAVADAERTFEVNAVRGPQFAQVGTLERLRPSLEFARRRREVHHRKAGPVNRDTFAEGEFPGERRGDHETLAGALGLDALDGSQGFDEAGEHGLAR